MKTNQKGFSLVEILLIVVIVGLIGTVGWLVYDRQSSKSREQGIASTKSKTENAAVEQKTVKSKALLRGNFGDNGEYGTLQAEGYASIIKVDEAYCFESCKQFDYVLFNITKTENPNITNYLKSKSGNAYTRENSIGIGCLANGVITYKNASDANQKKEFTIPQNETTQISASTTAKPIRLEIEKLVYTGGGFGGDQCWSDFSTFKLI